MVFTVSSEAFQNGGRIPDLYTCEGEDRSPPLTWYDFPSDTRSLVLVCDDPDAPMGTWDHWLLYNIDPARGGIPAFIPSIRILPDGETHGMNSWGREDYGGPCTPAGKPHRYFFKLYAISKDLKLPPGLKKSRLMERLKGHVIGKAELIGYYSR